MTIQMAELVERIAAEAKTVETLLEDRLRRPTREIPAHVVAHEINEAADELEHDIQTLWELRQSKDVE